MAQSERGALDRIKLNGPAEALAWKYPHDDIKLGSQLIVNETQQAVLVRDGRHLATFGPGRHTLTSANLPIVGRLVNLPFGGATPFAAEVWFFTMAADLQVRFGTATPIRLQEPQYNMIVPVRAHGQMGLRVGDCRTFLRELVGTMGGYTTEQVYASFRGMVMSKLKQVVAGAIIADRISLWEIATSLDLLSRRCHDAVRAEFARFGLTVVSLYLADVSLPEDDPAMRRLRLAAADITARLTQLKALFDQGFVTQAEYDAKREALLNEL